MWQLSSRGGGIKDCTGKLKNVLHFLVLMFNTYFLYYLISSLKTLSIGYHNPLNVFAIFFAKKFYFLFEQTNSCKDILFL